jgi:hypothetical protein
VLTPTPFATVDLHDLTEISFAIIAGVHYVDALDNTVSPTPIGDAFDDSARVGTVELH